MESRQNTQRNDQNKGPSFEAIVEVKHGIIKSILHILQLRKEPLHPYFVLRLSRLFLTLIQEIDPSSFFESISMALIASEDMDDDNDDRTGKFKRGESHSEKMLDMAGLGKRGKYLATLTDALHRVLTPPLSSSFNARVSSPSIDRDSVPVLIVDPRSVKSRKKEMLNSSSSDLIAFAQAVGTKWVDILSQTLFTTFPASVRLFPSLLKKRKEKGANPISVHFQSLASTLLTIDVHTTLIFGQMLRNTSTHIPCTVWLRHEETPQHQVNISPPVQTLLSSTQPFLISLLQSLPQSSAHLHHPALSLFSSFVGFHTSFFQTEALNQIIQAVASLLTTMTPSSTLHSLIINALISTLTTQTPPLLPSLASTEMLDSAVVPSQLLPLQTLLHSLIPQVLSHSLPLFISSPSSSFVLPSFISSVINYWLSLLQEGRTLHNSELPHGTVHSDQSQNHNSTNQENDVREIMTIFTLICDRMVLLRAESTQSSRQNESGIDSTQSRDTTIAPFLDRFSLVSSRLFVLLRHSLNLLLASSRESFERLSKEYFGSIADSILEACSPDIRHTVRSANPSNKKPAPTDSQTLFVPLSSLLQLVLHIQQNSQHKARFSGVPTTLLSKTLSSLACSDSFAGLAPSQTYSSIASFVGSTARLFSQSSIAPSDILPFFSQSFMLPNPAPFHSSVFLFGFHRPQPFLAELIASVNIHVVHNVQADIECAVFIPSLVKVCVERDWLSAHSAQQLEPALVKHLRALSEEGTKHVDPDWYPFVLSQLQSIQAGMFTNQTSHLSDTELQTHLHTQAHLFCSNLHHVVSDFSAISDIPSITEQIWKQWWPLWEHLTQAKRTSLATNIPSCHFSFVQFLQNYSAD